MAIEIHSSFLTPIKTVLEDRRVLGYMARLTDDSYVVQPYGKPMQHAKSQDEAMVADQGGAEGYSLRVRGWGRIQYLDNPEALQDEVGGLIAELLTEHWPTDARRQERD